MNRALVKAVGVKESKPDVLVIIPQDKAGFETHSWVTEIFRIPIIWILNALPMQIGRALFLGFSGPNGDARIAFRWAATYMPLERMYTFWERKARGRTNVSDNFWELFLSNARAIRNRLKLLEQELPKAIQEIARRKERVNLLSLGSGSARAILETINGLNGGYPVRVKLIDASRRAINFSKKLALSYGVDDIEWYRDLAQNLEKYCKDFQPDIVEMVGLLDYFSHEEALELIRKIYKILSRRSWFLISNIIPNSEAPFVSGAINWPLIYRTPTEIGELLLESGFRGENTKVLVEPLRVYALAVAKKIV